jgi:NADH-ubiquinone oxidoreductase chain 1
MIFFIGSIAETNRAPFDLAEAESELVSGFMTEHSASIFVFFFLGEYASILLICILNSILFLGGYLNIVPISSIIYILNNVFNIDSFVLEEVFGNFPSSSPIYLALKTGFLVFVFI